MIMEHGQRDRLKGGGAGGGDVHWRRNDAPSSGRQANFEIDVSALNNKIGSLSHMPVFFRLNFV